MKALKRMVKKGQQVIMKDELKCMKRVLRRLGYVNAENVIEVKVIIVLNYGYSTHSYH